MCASRSRSTPACSIASLRLNTLFGLTLSTLNAMMVTATGALALLLWTLGGRCRHGRDGAAAALADRQHFGLGRLAGDRHLRECRRGAGRHDDDRAADQLIDRPQAQALAVTRGEIAFEDVRFHYGRETSARETGVYTLMPCSKDFSLDGPPGREDRPGRPLGRRQVDGRQPAAALLRPRRRPHPDRRPGHRRGDAGEPARADLHGDAGHLAAASLDPRQHPLRPAGGERGGSRSRRRNSRMRRSSSPIWWTGGSAAATTPMSASAA